MRWLAKPFVVGILGIAQALLSFPSPVMAQKAVERWYSTWGPWSPTASSPAMARKTVEQAWDDEYRELAHQIERIQPGNNSIAGGWMNGWKTLVARERDESLGRQMDEWERTWRARLQAEALDPQALIQSGDKDPLDVVLRRTQALLDYHRRAGRIPSSSLIEFQTRWRELAVSAKEASQGEARRGLYTEVCRLRRQVALANPLLDFDRILCMLEQPGDYRFAEQARPVWRGHFEGGGPLVIEDFKSQCRLTVPLIGIPVEPASNKRLGDWCGKELTGKFSGLDLSYDGRALLFATTTSSEVWRIFKFSLDSKRLVQLTDGTYDDFDPCFLPSGRIVFTSTRRCGIGRCNLSAESLTYTLYSMEPDGSDIVPLSFHETNELQPSVNHDGKLVYTRWDYVDRHWGTAHHFWECFPDGRDPRSYHGNYPQPWSAMLEGIQPEQYGFRGLVYGRLLRPDMEVSFRAVPGSHKYTATAVGHHCGFSGTLVMVDPRVPDDGKMSQVKRITPECMFPEVEPDDVYCWQGCWGAKKEAYLGTEFPARMSGAYGTAWPLSEDFYLCNFQWGLYLLDRFGNREMIYDPGRGPYRVRNPFPLRAREKPPAIPVMTWQGKRSSLPDHQRAVIGVMNVYDTDEMGTLPKGVKIKSMRIVQVIPQLLLPGRFKQTVDIISFATDSIGRIPLGTVPVEEDGSVYCEAPVGKAIYFQLLDEKGMAVQSMRSATYIHPGERLTCQGCHEDKWKSVRPPSQPAAFLRAPSQIVPEIGDGAIPFNFYRLVKRPVFDRKCVPCHREHPKAPDMSYASLARHDWVFAYPGEYPAFSLLGVGGSRTTPGRFGARASGLMKSLSTKDYHKSLDMSKDDWRRLTLWLDLNSNEIGWIGNDWSEIQAQKQGVALWPPIDVDPLRPSGIEAALPVGPGP